MPIIFEELGWGDSGLAIFTLATAFPAFAALVSGNAALIEEFANKIGCWVVTQPDRGSDLVDYDVTEIYPGTKQNRANLHATIDSDHVIVNGQSSAWVSGAPAAEACLVSCQCDYGDGIHDEQGGLHYVTALVNFDQAGISKGKPLDKLGQRALPQGEIFFDNVRIPKSHVLYGKEQAYANFFGTITFANMEMAATFTGVARAAYEHALRYVHERKQGGTQIINHQSVRLRLFDIWQKVEACRALSQQVFNYNYSKRGPHLLASVTAKTFVTDNAFDVCSEALQLFGGNGLTKDYPVEKLLRDARAAMIEDGENNILNLKGASWLSKWFKANN